MFLTNMISKDMAREHKLFIMPWLAVYGPSQSGSTIYHTCISLWPECHLNINVWSAAEYGPRPERGREIQSAAIDGLPDRHRCGTVRAEFSPAICDVTGPMVAG